MKNRDPPKPHILKEVSNDMLLELSLLASILHNKLHVFSCFSWNGSPTSFFFIFPEFYQKSAILDSPLAPSWVQIATQITQVPPKYPPFKAPPATKTSYRTRPFWLFFVRMALGHQKGEKMSPQCRPSTPKGFQR